MFLSGGIDAEQHLAERSAFEPGDNRSVFLGNDADVEVGIEVAVGIDDVFDQAGGAAVADAFELRADQRALRRRWAWQLAQWVANTWRPRAASGFAA